MTTIDEVGIHVDAITEVVSDAPIFTFEFKQIFDAVRKFRDFFAEHHAKWGISAQDLQVLYNSVGALEDRKFGDVILSKEQNHLVDALCSISKMAQSVYATPNLLLYWYNGVWDNFMSPSLQQYYLAYLSGHLADYNACLPRPNCVLNSVARHAWSYRNWCDMGCMSALEGWFYLNRYFGKCKMRAKVVFNPARTGHTHFTVVFLKSGIPLGQGSLHIKSRGDVVKLGEYSWVAPAYPPTSMKFERIWIEQTFTFNDTVSYVVPCIIDDHTTKVINSWFEWFELQDA